MHLVIDGFGGDPQLLADASLVQEMLESYPDMLGMAKICQPVVVRYQGPVPEDWGISGVVMIAESHIAVHTFPERGMVWADIFSCRPFEAGPVLDDLRRRFGLKELEVQELRRGLEYLGPAPQRQTISG
ncbi:MAG TPA: S-adenosylmethionine decarboxylase [Dehalococcoidia bacterium]|nr:S-adenosylmethionine decarboxylase [Dehalococcoidia bacterium]